MSLFDVLVARLSSKPKPIIDESYNQKLNNVLNSLSLEEAEQVTVLMLHHYNLLYPGVINMDTFASRSKLSKLPYGIKCSPGMKGFSFVLDLMPDDLKMLIGEYCELN